MFRPDANCLNDTEQSTAPWDLDFVMGVKWMILKPALTSWKLSILASDFTVTMKSEFWNDSDPPWCSPKPLHWMVMRTLLGSVEWYLLQGEKVKKTLQARLPFWFLPPSDFEHSVSTKLLFFPVKMILWENVTSAIILNFHKMKC